MLRLLLTLLVFITSTQYVQAEDLYFPSFDEGLCRGGRSTETFKKKFQQTANNSRIRKLKAKTALFRSTYDLAVAKLTDVSEEEPVTIPKIIHVIWLGAEIPEKYAQWQDTWQNLTGWEYHLWTDKEVENLTLINRRIYNASHCYGEKSDILRIELLYQFGGLYVDTDFACINPAYFEQFHRCLDFYIGTEPLENSPFSVGNAIIGSKAGHPFLLKLINELPENYQLKNGNCAVETTGPSYVTNTLINYLNASDKNKSSISVFPSSFFYPLTIGEITKQQRSNFSLIHPSDFAPETCGIHFWEGSWLVE
jgi:mannosyltransferase OCH1-like enzyme